LPILQDRVRVLGTAVVSFTVSGPAYTDYFALAHGFVPLVTGDKGEAAHGGVTATARPAEHNRVLTVFPIVLDLQSEGVVTRLQTYQRLYGQEVMEISWLELRKFTLKNYKIFAVRMAFFPTMDVCSAILCSGDTFQD